MQMQNFHAASAAFENATRIPPPLLKPLQATPFTAILLDPQMRDVIESKVRVLYGNRDGALMPLYRYGASLEPPIDEGLRPVVTAAVDDRDGLQILLVRLNGQTRSKDGIPYHIIWCAEDTDNALVSDKTYRWPVTTIEKITGSPLNPQFVKSTQNIPYDRVMTRLEKRAEDLARLAASHAEDGRDSFMGNQYDYLKLDISLHIPPSGYDPAQGIEPSQWDCIYPLLFRVEPRENGARTMSPIPWWR